MPSLSNSTSLRFSNNRNHIRSEYKKETSTGTSHLLGKPYGISTVFSCRVRARSQYASGRSRHRPNRHTMFPSDMKKMLRRFQYHDTTACFSYSPPELTSSKLNLSLWRSTNSSSRAARQTSGVPRTHIFRVSASHLYTFSKTSWPWDRSVTGPLSIKDNTNSGEKKADIHAPSGISTHDPRVRKAEDNVCFTPRGHCNRLASKLPSQIMQIPSN
jgi:hypothetical protein